MSLIFRAYLASLREREELDAILPDLLSELGYTVYSRPQRGTAQAGVDVAAVGTANDGERKVFLFSVKQGDLTRNAWNDGTPQALLPSLDDIRYNYIPHRIPKTYQNLKIVICLVVGGTIREEVRSAVTGYINEHLTDRISFAEWNGDELAKLMQRGILREEIMPKLLRFHFQKAVALVDEPDISYQHFQRLVLELCKSAKDNKSRVRIVRQLYIALWVLFVWARDADNVEAPYRCSELVLLSVWNLFRRYAGKKPNVASKAIKLVLDHAVGLHIAIASELLERKILPHVCTLDGISAAIRTQSPADVNLKLFDVLGRIALTGFWLYWLSERDTDEKRRSASQSRVAALAKAGIQLIGNNRALFLPLQDSHAIEIALFLCFLNIIDGTARDANLWLREIVARLAFVIRTHGRYPCVFTEYRDLEAHPRELTEEYRRKATSGSALIPLLAAFLACFEDQRALTQLAGLMGKELRHCTLQLWMPDAASEHEFYIGSQGHGLALHDLPLSATGAELIRIVRRACTHKAAFFSGLSAIAEGYSPIILTACRHHRLPVPPQYWIDIVDPPPEA